MILEFQTLAFRPGRARGTTPHENPRHRRRRLHRRLPRGRVAQRRPRGDRPRQFLEIRSRSSAIAEAPRLPLRAGRRQGRRPARRADARRRPGRRRRRHDRRHQLLPRVRLRPPRRKRAAHRRRLRRRDRRPQARHAQENQRHQLVDGVRERDGLADAGGGAAPLRPAALHLRLPEAGDGILRAGGVGAVPAAVHDLPAVQLRRRRRAAGPVRGGGAERQRAAGDETTSAGT